MFSKKFYKSFRDAIKPHLPSFICSYLIFVSSIVSIRFSFIQYFPINYSKRFNRKPSVRQFGISRVSFTINLKIIVVIIPFGSRMIWKSRRVLFIPKFLTCLPRSILIFNLRGSRLHKCRIICKSRIERDV